jgi:hypothetical protein
MLCKNPDRSRRLTHADQSVLDIATFRTSYVKRRKDFCKWEACGISEAVEEPLRCLLGRV